jgi:hypothetical protein
MGTSPSHRGTPTRRESDDLYFFAVKISNTGHAVSKGKWERMGVLIVF